MKEDEYDEFVRLYRAAKYQKNRTDRPTDEEWAAYREGDIKKAKKLAAIKTTSGIRMKWGKMHEMEVKGISMQPVPRPESVEVA